MRQIHREMNAFYREHLAQRATRGGEVGMKTRRERRVFFERMVHDLHDAGLQVRRLKNLGGKHIRCLLELWWARDLQPATWASYVSHLRWILTGIKKDGILRSLDEYLGAHPELTRRSTATSEDRSDEAAGVDFAVCLGLARALDEHFACQLLMIKRFGLRSQEAWLFRPHLAEIEPGQLQIRWGTKGGRPRVVPIENAEQREALASAQRLVASRAESLIPRGWSVPKWRRRYYYLCEKVGLTRRASHATPHSLRHGVLLDQYAQLAGEPAPVRGGTLARTDPCADRAARTVVAEFAGHSRPQVTSAYLGSPRRARPPTLTGESSEVAVSAIPASEHSK